MTTPAWNIAMAWVNLADAGTITVPGAVTLAPASRLQNKHVMRKCRVNSTNIAIICDLGSTQSLDTFALMGMSGTDPALRVRVSTADISGAAGDAYDSGSLSGAWDSNYLPFVHLLSSPVSGRYTRIDVSEGGVVYTEAGRLLNALRQQFSINFQPGWTRTWNDPSIRTIGRSGQTYDDPRDKYRSYNLTVDFASEDDRWNIIEPIDIALGTHGDMLIMSDPSSSNLSRDSIWGYMESAEPVVEPVIVADGSRFRKTYPLRERL